MLTPSVTLMLSLLKVSVYLSFCGEQRKARGDENSKDFFSSVSFVVFNMLCEAFPRAALYASPPLEDIIGWFEFGRLTAHGGMRLAS